MGFKMGLKRGLRWTMSKCNESRVRDLWCGGRGVGVKLILAMPWYIEYLISYIGCDHMWAKWGGENECPQSFRDVTWFPGGSCLCIGTRIKLPQYLFTTRNVCLYLEKHTNIYVLHRHMHLSIVHLDSHTPKFSGLGFKLTWCHRFGVQGPPGSGNPDSCNGK